MASAAMGKMAFKIICLVILFSFHETDAASAGDITKVIGQLYKKAIKNRTPLILVLDNHALNQNSVEESEQSENSLLSLLSRPAKSNRNPISHLLNKKTLLPNLRTEDLKSPLVKGLLSLRNGLSCAAKAECKRECRAYRQGKKQCEDECGDKYDCEEEKENDDCASEDECAESNDCDDKVVSTKGELWEQETVKCKRC